jgi:predicted RNase H-like HicB family nuclease
MKLTLVISKGEDFFIGTIKEIPGVITQGESIKETRENIMDALGLYLEAMEAESNLENVVLEEDIAISYVS